MRAGGRVAACPAASAKLKVRHGPKSCTRRALVAATLDRGSAGSSRTWVEPPAFVHLRQRGQGARCWASRGNAPSGVTGAGERSGGVRAPMGGRGAPWPDRAAGSRGVGHRRRRPPAAATAEKSRSALVHLAASADRATTSSPNATSSRANRDFRIRRVFGDYRPFDDAGVAGRNARLARRSWLGARLEGRGPCA